MKKFKKFLKVYYALAKESTGSVYGTWDDQKKAEEISGFHDASALVSEAGLVEICKLLEPESRKNLDEKLEDINKHYGPVTKLIKNEVISEDGLKIIANHMCSISTMAHDITRHFSQDKKVMSSSPIDHSVWCGFYYHIAPEQTIINDVSTALFISLGTYEKYKDSFQLFESTSNDEFWNKIGNYNASDARAYLNALPNRITIENIVPLKELGKEHEILDINYNTNISLMQEIRK